ncbi:MAG: hypothetical protein J6C39_04755 [Clostridia bacterium]|nr:hypothetical protein [Clostridia bacterium]MBO5205986.1 hypothetical protein [Clostridia bacterium]
MSIEKILERLKNPPKPVAVITFVLTAVFATLSFVLLAVGYEGNILLEISAYASFGLAGVTLAYSVYLGIKYGKSIVLWVKAVLHSFSFTEKMLESFNFRTVVTAVGYLIMGIAYSLFNGVLGIVYGSIWYGALACYYIILTLARGGVVSFHYRRASEAGFEVRSVSAYKRCGVLLLLLNITLSSAIAQMIFDDRGFVYPGWIVIAYAAYAFYKITMATVNLVKAKSSEAYTVKAIRCINLVDAAVSILALQTALLYAYSPDNLEGNSLANTLTGSAVTLLTVGISIYMLINANKKKKSFKEQSINE